MPIPLKDIPHGKLTPDEIEAISNDTFDYADREQVSLREAGRKIKEQADSDSIRRHLIRVGDWDSAQRVPTYEAPYNLEQGYGDFTFKEKTFEIMKAAHRGLGSVVKLPGTALKALGELPLTRREIAELKESPYAFQRFRAKLQESPLTKVPRSFANVLRKAGNKYIDTVNGMTSPESMESQGVRTFQSFGSAPLYRTAMAVSESAPSYGVAIASTIASGNPNIGLMVLGTTTASSSYENYREMGIDPDLSLIGATLEGTIEVLTEKVPMDMLMKGAGRPFLMRALRQGTAESFQELFAQLGQNYVNAVIKDVDPENYATVLSSAKQEWSIITQGWQDAMAAGFAMGGGAAVAVSPQDSGLRTTEQLKAEYGFVPRNTPELLSLMNEIKKRVKSVEKEAKDSEKAKESTDVAPVKPKLKDLTFGKGLPVDAPQPKQGVQQAKGEKVVDFAKADLFPDAKTGSLESEANKTFLLIKDATASLGKLGDVVDTATQKGIDVYKKELQQQLVEISTPPQQAKGEKGIDIGEGEVKPRGTSVSIMAKAIEDELVSQHELDEVPTYKAMNMREQAEKSLALIENDLEQAKRVAFYKEASPDPTLYPENVFSALRVYATQNLDIDLIMDLALNEDVVREHTIMGKRIKSLDTDQDSADPIRAIREVVSARTEKAVRQGKDLSALETKLRELQAELESTKKANIAFIKRAGKAYGGKNTLVTRAEYDSIIARRKKEMAQLKHTGRTMGAVYVPTLSDFVDIAKIAIFHLEAMGRDFNKWSYQMTKDFGEWITPYLQDEYDKAIAEAKKAGIEIKESKRLTTKKKRLATTTAKLETKFKEQDLEKIPRIPIELDEEGQRLQNAYDAAREKYKAAQAVANIITEEEVRIITQLSKDVAERKALMEKSKRRKGELDPATIEEYEFGIAMSLFIDYMDDLKRKANERTMNEVMKNYLKNPVDFVSDAAGTFKAAKASLDDSFIGRQGWRTFLKGITGDIASMKIWMDTFTGSFRVLWDTLGKKKVMQGLFAEIVSDPDYELLKKAGVALKVIEEEIPVDIPSRIPYAGMLFRMGENAFVWSGRYMRYKVAKNYLRIWRKSGVELTKNELQSLGRLTNSQTARGEIAASQNKKPGLLNNLFWSPRNLRAHVDVLTIHLFDRNFSTFARKQAALNLLRYISGAAMILSISKWIDDDSVTWDTNSADFGKIKVGNTRFSVGGGMEILIILASRLVTREFTSSTTEKKKSIDTGKFGAISGKDLVWNFVENKLSPASSLALTLINQKTRQNGNLTIPQMVNDALTPLIIQNVFETGSNDDSANILAALIAEALGVNVQTYSNNKYPKRKNRKRI